MTATAPRPTLRAALDAERPLVTPLAHDALSARLIARAGFRAFAIGGSALLAARYGLPDIGLIGLADMTAGIRDIAAAPTPAASPDSTRRSAWTACSSPGSSRRTGTSASAARCALGFAHVSYPATVLFRVTQAMGDARAQLCRHAEGIATMPPDAGAAPARGPAGSQHGAALRRI